MDTLALVLMAIGALAAIVLVLCGVLEIERLRREIFKHRSYRKRNSL